MSEYSFDLKSPFAIEAESILKTAEAIDPAEFEKAVKALAKEMKVDFADPGKKLLGKDGKIVESNFTDGLHPSAGGYKLIAEDFK